MFDLSSISYLHFLQVPVRFCCANLSIIIFAGRSSASIAWSSRTGNFDYRVQHRSPDFDPSWTLKSSSFVLWQMRTWVSFWTLTYRRICGESTWNFGKNVYSIINHCWNLLSSWELTTGWLKWEIKARTQLKLLGRIKNRHPLLLSNT